MSIEEEKTNLVNVLIGEFKQMGLSEGCLLRATELAAKGLNVALDDRGEVVKKFCTTTEHKDAAAYAAAILSQHHDTIFFGQGGRSFQQMMHR